ncbi:MFS transporter [Paenibacillus sp. 5J-6]|uniref:MFS transporter n=1 Tax=Paenibacillus silvestris TaxID=2606219 RepID=A0A6L8USQ5_9BACL|nr:MFS transporter [Paenibacillus silvestris]MZQ80964.1 MFS transporter [Paenibacillus silvestris]
MNLQNHWRISILTVLAIGPGLMINSALVPSQSLIQHSLQLGNNVIFAPTLVGIIAFMLFIPMGPLLRRRLGVRATYSISMTLFIIGSLWAALSVNDQWMSVGRFLQGVGMGVMLMIMVPMLLLSFPIEKRNLSLSVLIGGFFGSVIAGLLIGNIAIIYHYWRWIFYLGSALALAGLMMNQIFLRNEHHTESKQFNGDILGISLILICSVISLVTLSHFEQWFGSSGNLWVVIGSAFITLILFIIAQRKINHPVISFKLIMHPKPLLGILMALLSNVVMALSLPAVQGLLHIISSKQLLSLLPCMFIGVVLSAIICTLFYDKLGPGLLGLLGSAAITLVLIQWFYLNDSYSLVIMAFNLILLSSGLGITIGAGLTGAALGGPLPELVSRMTAVQFIRFLANIIVILLAGWYLNFDYSHKLKDVVQSGRIGDEQKQHSLSLLMTYHDLFFIAFISAAVLACLSIGLHLTGKGHKLAHKPHHEHELAK